MAKPWLRSIFDRIQATAAPSRRTLTFPCKIRHSQPRRCFYEAVKRREAPHRHFLSARLGNHADERALWGLGLLCPQRQTTAAEIRPAAGPPHSRAVAKSAALGRRFQLLEQ